MGVEEPVRDGTVLVVSVAGGQHSGFGAVRRRAPDSLLRGIDDFSEPTIASEPRHARHRSRPRWPAPLPLVRERAGVLRLS